MKTVYTRGTDDTERSKVAAPRMAPRDIPTLYSAENSAMLTVSASCSTTASSWPSNTMLKADMQTPQMIIGTMTERPKSSYR